MVNWRSGGETGESRGRAVDCSKAGKKGDADDEENVHGDHKQDHDSDEFPEATLSIEGGFEIVDGLRIDEIFDVASVFPKFEGGKEVEKRKDSVGNSHAYGHRSGESGAAPSGGARCKHGSSGDNNQDCGQDHQS